MGTQPEILLAIVCRNANHLGVGDLNASSAATILDIFIASRAQILVVESPVGFLGMVARKEDLLPQLNRTKCAVEAAALSAAIVGLPTWKAASVPCRRPTTARCRGRGIIKTCAVEKASRETGLGPSDSGLFLRTQGIILPEEGERRKGSLLVLRDPPGLPSLKRTSWAAYLRLKRTSDTRMMPDQLVTRRSCPGATVQNPSPVPRTPHGKAERHGRGDKRVHPSIPG